MKNKKASVTLFLAFMITAIIIVLIAAVFAPMGVLFNTEAYLAGEDILAQANVSIAAIQDDGVRNSVQATVVSARAAAQNNIQINSDIFKYSWIFIIGLVALVVFLYTRRLNEINTGFI